MSETAIYLLLMLYGTIFVADQRKEKERKEKINTEIEIYKILWHFEYYI